MKRGIVVYAMLAIALGGAALVWAAAAAAVPKAGGNARTVLDDIRVCTDGGRFMVAYTPSAQERPNRIRITANGTTLVDRSIMLRRRTARFPGLTIPDSSGGGPDPFGDTRPYSRTRTYEWRPLKPDTALRVTVFGAVDGPEEFPVQGEQDILVGACYI